MADPMQAETEESVDIELEETERPNDAKEVVIEETNSPETN